MKKMMNSLSGLVFFTSVLCMIALFTIINGTIDLAEAKRLQEADCRACHGAVEYIPDTHHLFVNQSCVDSQLVLCENDTATYVCLSCHDMEYNKKEGIWETIVIRDCTECHRKMDCPPSG